MEKKRFGAFLKHFSLAQNTLKSYHKWPKSRFNLQGTVVTTSLLCLNPEAIEKSGSFYKSSFISRRSFFYRMNNSEDPLVPNAG